MKGSARCLQLEKSLSPNKINIAPCLQGCGACPEKSAITFVGYQNKASLGGSLFDFVTPTFEKVDGTTLMLDDFKLDYEELDQTTQYLVEFTAGAASGQQYYYLSAAVVDDWGEDPSLVGWYLDENCTDPAVNVPLPYGHGFAISAEAATTKIVFSGAVKPIEAPVSIAGGSTFVFTGNCIPADMELKDMKLVYEGLDQTIQYLVEFTRGAASGQQYYYLDEKICDDWGESYDLVGWYTDENCVNPIEKVEMPAGYGFAVNAENACQLVIPSPVK